MWWAFWASVRWCSNDPGQCSVFLLLLLRCVFCGRDLRCAQSSRANWICKIQTTVRVNRKQPTHWFFYVHRIPNRMNHRGMKLWALMWKPTPKKSTRFYSSSFTRAPFLRMGMQGTVFDVKQYLTSFWIFKWISLLRCEDALKKLQRCSLALL